MGKATYEDIVKLLAILGGIVTIIEAILYFGGRSVQKYYNLGWIAAIIAIIFGILVLFRLWNCYYNLWKSNRRNISINCGDPKTHF